ncbi:O-antigen ligase family protein [Roseisolibacter sp. H3M3-2]|uniref:O-antigen ligase family protein n=1 Tax=Roseisolibacter sp. H3M3-2 TaxID=3031323 RepID=UPI0023DCB0D5|nr:O-antigen ligase family protein [Roseisolibacter sp. H3M3-2]MDF1501755.1 O-antigen ligase family protein [Roseisolibacter sp. H3M3-2]
MPLLPPLAAAHPAHRLAVRALQVGATCVALAALRYKLFELDRFFVPKELVLHATAALVAVAALRAPRRPDGSTDPLGRHDAFAGTAFERPVAGGLTLVDAALALFLACSALAAALAGNGWLGARALAISLSSAALFWGARALARAGLGRTVLAAVGVALVVGAATSLLQAYGVESAYFSLNRAPGGTFGNRNFVAHLAAIGTPILAGLALRARRRRHALLACVGAAALATVLVLSRSRGAWLAAAAASVPLALGVARALALPGTRPKLGRVLLLLVALGGGALAALRLPNTLEWKSDSPYLDSVKGVVDYRGGSGRGRLKQYANSARMALDHPLLGVGPGNWAADYPRYAPAGDPSLTGDGTTANPWPSSDWVAILSERGLPAFLALGATMLGLAWWAHGAVWRGRDADGALTGGVLGATLAAALVVGAFDAVLLLPAPAFLTWAALGALAVESGAVDRAPRPIRWPRLARRLAWAALAAAALLGALRSAGQAGAMALFSTGRAVAIARAAELDRGSYRIQLRAAELARARGRCADVRRYATRAAELLPSAPAPKRLLAACRPRRRG